MERLVALGAVLAFVSVCHTSPQKSATVVVDDGRLGIGLITGGTFGPGSFSIGGSGGGRPPQMHVYLNEDDDGAHIILQNPSHDRGQQDNRPPQRGSAESNNSGGGNRGNTQLYPVKPQTTHIISGQGGMGGEGGSDGGQIYVGTVIIPNNKNTKENKKKNSNQQTVATDTNAIEAIFANNIGSNGKTENGFASTSGQESIQIGSITGGKFAEGTGSLNNNRPGANVPRKEQKESTVNNGNTEYSYAGNEALYSIGHGANNNGTGNAGDGHSYGQKNSGHNSESSEEPWIWSR